MKFWSVGLLALAFASAGFGQRITDAEVMQRATRLIERQLFWTGLVPGEKSFRVGKVVDVVIITSASEVVAFFDEIGLTVYLALQDGRVVREGTGGFSPLERVKTIESYISSLAHVFSPGTNGVIDSPFNRSQAKAQVPVETPSPYSRRNAMYRLPILGRPGYRPPIPQPSSLSAMEAKVRATVATYLNPTCGVGSAIIPRFAQDEPVIYVLVDLRLESLGIIPFVRQASGQYAPANLRMDRKPNDLRFTIQQIRANTASSVDVSVGRCN